MQTEGVQGAIGKPPVAVGETCNRYRIRNG